MARQIITREDLQEFISLHFDRSEENIMTAETAVDPADAGKPMYGAPLVRIGTADDALWEEFKKPGAVGSFYRTPKDWLPEAKTVISVFGPWSDHVVQSNAAEPVYPGSAWISSYAAGGALIKRLSVQLADWLTEQGYPSIAPAMSKDFLQVYEDGTNPNVPAGNSYASNWSERHAAFVCGQGTFGLSRGIITEKGMAGRFCSVVTTLELEPDVRPYEGLYDYCVFCGKCAKNCPPQAISMETGKDHSSCNAWLTEMRRRNGIAGCCGKCQVNVPCSRRIPKATLRR